LNLIVVSEKAIVAGLMERESSGLPESEAFK
jgi:hypothetical protein